MKVLSKKIENHTAYLTIEANPDEMEEYLDKAYKRMVNWQPIPGFKKGEAPREALEKHFGRDKLLEEANKELITNLYNKALKDEGLEFIGEAAANVIQKEPLIFDLVVALKPIVEIGDYRSIRLPPEQSEEPTYNDIKAVLESIQRKFVDYVLVDRPAKVGDVLTVDIESTVMNSPFIQGKGKQLPVSKDYPSGIPEFHEHLIGIKTNEERQFRIKIPDNYPYGSIVGKEALFKCKVIEIHEERLPELSDSLAQLAAPDIRTMDALRERIAQKMKLDYEEKAKIKFEEKLMATLIERSRLEISSRTIELEADALLQDGLAHLRESCEKQEDFEYKLRQLPQDKLREKYREVARKRILWNVILSEVAKKELIDVSMDEIEQEIEKMTQAVSLRERGKQFKLMHQPSYQEDIKTLIMARRTIALLSEIATSPVNEGVK